MAVPSLIASSLGGMIRVERVAASEHEGLDRLFAACTFSAAILRSSARSFPALREVGLLE
jgi:hypothetical protein